MAIHFYSLLFTVRFVMKHGENIERDLCSNSITIPTLRAFNETTVNI